MKRLKLMQRSIITLNMCTLLLCSIVNGMDESVEPMFTTVGNDTPQLIKISLSTSKMSNALELMLGDTAKDKPIEELITLAESSLPIPLDFPADTIKSVFTILDTYKNNPKSTLIQEKIAPFSLQQLIEAINFLQSLDLKDTYETVNKEKINCTEIIKQFMKNLEQQLSKLSLIDIESNKEIIDSLNIDLKSTISREIIARKRIDILRNKKIIPTKNEAVVINIDFFPKACAFSRDGKKIALGQHGTTMIFDAQTGEKISMLVHETSVRSLNFSHDDKLILARCEAEIDIWSTGTYKKIQQLNNDLKNPHKALFSPTDKFIAASFVDKTIIWQRNEGSVLYTQLCSIDKNFTIAEDFSPNETCLILSQHKNLTDKNTEYSSYTLWNIKEQKFLPNPFFESARSLLEAQFSLDGTKIFGLSVDQLFAWDTKTLNREINRYHPVITDMLYNSCILLSPDSSMYIQKTSSGHLHTISCIETITGDTLCKIDTEAYGIDNNRVIQAFFSPDNNKIAICNNWDLFNQIGVDMLKLPEPLLIINLFDPNKLETLKSLSFVELLKIIATEKEQKRIETEKEQAYFTKAVELNIFNLRKIAAQSLANIRAKISSWWKSWVAKQMQ